MGVVRALGRPGGHVRPPDLALDTQAEAPALVPGTAPAPAPNQGRDAAPAKVSLLPADIPDLSRPTSGHGPASRHVFPSGMPFFPAVAGSCPSAPLCTAQTSPLGEAGGGQELQHETAILLLYNLTGYGWCRLFSTTKHIILVCLKNASIACLHPFFK